jgi:purine-binding chemotaxis protein CheW
MIENLQSASEQITAQFPDEKYLTFRVNETTYGINIKFVREIVGIQKIIVLPDMPPYVKGIINLRGHVIPVLDVRIRFGMEENNYNDRTCIIVVDVKDSTVGLITDSVNEVASIPSNRIEPPPQISQDEKNYFIQSVAKFENEIKIILDVNKLLFENDYQKIEPISPERGL